MTTIVVHCIKCGKLPRGSFTCTLCTDGCVYIYDTKCMEETERLRCRCGKMNISTIQYSKLGKPQQLLTAAIFERRPTKLSAKAPSFVPKTAG